MMVNPNTAIHNGPPIPGAAPTYTGPPTAGSGRASSGNRYQGPPNAGSYGPPAGGKVKATPPSNAMAERSPANPSSGAAKPKRDSRIDPRQIPRPKFHKNVAQFTTKAAKKLIPSSLTPVVILD